MFCYTTQSAMGSISPAYSTSATPNTEIDVYSVKPGSSRMTSVYNFRGQGRGAGLTALSGISLNLKDWTTASTLGSALTPTPNDKGNTVAAVSVPRIGTGGGVNAVTPGSGGPLYRGGFGMGASGPGGWVAANPDAYIAMNAGYAGSLDIYSLSGLASMLYEFWQEHAE